jgi:hypothetical protein
MENQKIEKPLSKTEFFERNVHKMIEPYVMDDMGPNLVFQLEQYFNGKRSAEDIRTNVSEKLEIILEQIKSARDGTFVDSFGKDQEEENKAA